MDKKKLKFNIIFLIVWLFCGYLGAYWIASIPSKPHPITNGQGIALICFGPISTAAAGCVALIEFEPINTAAAGCATGCVALIEFIISHNGTWLDEPFTNHPNNQRIPDAEDMDNK